MSVFKHSYVVWCPALGETAEIATPISAEDAQHAARNYAHRLVDGHRVVDSGELVSAAAESFAIEADDRIDLATRWVVARGESV